MGLGYALTEDFPTDDDRLPHQHDAAAARHPAAQGRAADRGRSSSSRPSRTRPTASRASARSASCRRPARWPPRCTTSTASGAPTLPMRRAGAGRRAPTSDAPTHARAWSAATTTSTRRWPGACRRRPGSRRDFLEILEQVWWRLDVALDLEMIRWSAMLGAARGAASAAPRRSSTTTRAPTPSRAASTSSPTRAPRSACGSSCAYGVTDRHGRRRRPRAGLAENERFLRDGGRGMVGVHAAFTCTDETLDAAAGLAADLGVGVHIHVAEGPDRRGAGARLAAAGAPTTGCSSTACTSTATCPGTIAHNPRSQHEQRRRLRPPGRSAQPGRARHRRHRRRHARGVPPRLRRPPGRRRARPRPTRRGRWLDERLARSCPRPATTG